MKVLFCNIAWMQWYKDVRDIDEPQNGGAYVNQYHTGSEVDNFWPLAWILVKRDDAVCLSLRKNRINTSD